MLASLFVLFRLIVHIAYRLLNTSAAVYNVIPTAYQEIVKPGLSGLRSARIN